MSAKTVTSVAQQLEDLAKAWTRNKPDSASERRSAERRPFTSPQRIAPFRGEIPAADEYEVVNCHDLSQGGFSFFAESLPNQDTIICVFNTRHAVLHLTAQVRYVKRIQKGEEPLFLVGCRFLQRIKPEAG